MLNWFDVKVKYEKTQEEGKIVKIVEEYLFDALSFTEAEARVYEELTPFISGEFITAAIKREKINEMFSNVNGDKWYRSKVAFISLDEIKGVEKRTLSTMMVQANDIQDAWNVLKEGMKGSMADYEVLSITETKILDVYNYVVPKEEEK